MKADMLAYMLGYVHPKLACSTVALMVHKPKVFGTAKMIEVMSN